MVARSGQEWWSGRHQEICWCEVTERIDIGADLKAPPAEEGGEDYWSYSLLHYVAPSDLVFHYSTRGKAYVGISVAGGPLEERLPSRTGASERRLRNPSSPRPDQYQQARGRRAAEPIAPSATSRSRPLNVRFSASPLRDRSVPGGAS
jgi:hypothetical protein